MGRVLERSDQRGRVTDGSSTPQEQQSTGNDGIPAEVYKAIVKGTEMRNRAVDGKTQGENAETGTLLTALVHAVNTLFNGCISEELQSSLLISIFKKNDPADMDNYRGISLMPVLLKITCSVIAVRLSN